MGRVIVSGASDSVSSIVTTDVCVIGSGAAGIALALTLDRAPLRVTVLEAGGIDRRPAEEEEAFRVEHVGIPFSNPYPTRGRVFGGSTKLWFGRIATFDDIDFTRRPWIEHSGWPIAGSDLDDWLPVAADLLEVEDPHRLGIGGARPSERLDTPTWATGDGLRIEPFIWCAAIDMGSRHHEAIRRSSNVTLVTDAPVSRLALDASGGAVEKVTCTLPGARSLEVRAQATVLAAGGLANPRLLLASARDHRSAIGNRNDVVGRYFMDHPRSVDSATVGLEGVDRRRVDELRRFGEHVSSSGSRLQLRFAFSEQYQRERRLLNHSVHADFSADLHERPGYQALAELRGRIRPSDTPPPPPSDSTPTLRLLGSAVKDLPAVLSHAARRLRGPVPPTRMHLHDQMEQSPDPNSRVTVDWSTLDRWGLPRLLVNWRVSDATYESQREMHTVLQSMFRDAGIASFSSTVLDGEPPPVMEMKHPSGATRMGASASDSVVDRDLRVHDVSNLFVVGSSVFPTVGHANPTFTIVALAARLGDHLRHRLRSPARTAG